MKPFQVLVKPAAGDCNLACDYCFYRRATSDLYPEESRHRMSRELLEKLVRDLLSYRFPETVFCWQGGEPTLMGLDFFEDVIRTQLRHGRSGQVVGNALQTNGLLIDGDWARFLAEYKVVVGLSLDGPRDIHDRHRKNIGGAGSFERVMAAAELLLRHGVAVNVLCVVNRTNQERAGEVYRFLRAQGFDYIQFIPCLETDPGTGEVLPFSATPEGLGRFFREAFECYRTNGFPRVSERNFDAVLGLHLTGRAGLCTFEPKCGNYLVVEYNGDIYPCDFFVQQNWRLGNLAEKPLKEFFGHPRMKKFSAAKARVAPECRSCRWFGFCHGGCLKDRLPGRAKGAGRTWFCRSYQELFDCSERDMKKWAEQIKQGQDGPAARPAPLS